MRTGTNTYRGTRNGPSQWFGVLVLLVVASMIILMIGMVVTPWTAHDARPADAEVFDDASRHYGADTVLLQASLQPGAGEEIDRVVLQTHSGQYLDSAPVPPGTTSVRLDTYEQGDKFTVVGMVNGDVVERMDVTLKRTPIWEEEAAEHFDGVPKVPI